MPTTGQHTKLLRIVLSEYLRRRSSSGILLRKWATGIDVGWNEVINYPGHTWSKIPASPCKGMKNQGMHAYFAQATGVFRAALRFVHFDSRVWQPLTPEPRISDDQSNACNSGTVKRSAGQGLHGK
jgi:hypothetical protein